MPAAILAALLMRLLTVPIVRRGKTVSDSIAPDQLDEILKVLGSVTRKEYTDIRTECEMTLLDEPPTESQLNYVKEWLRRELSHD